MKQYPVIKKFGLPCIAFFAVGAVYMLYFVLCGFYPFGERSIAWCDLEQQYLPLLMELRGIIKEDGSLFLGKGGGGMNFWGVFLFFVSSPLGLLSLFVSEDKMIYFVNILTVLKLSLCGASASNYFRQMFKALPNSFNILLSIMYSFSGYVMLYYQNNMWLDVMIIFPLLTLSMFRLCREGKWLGYTLMLSLTMLLNFYLSYMIIIFILISFGVMLVFCCSKENRGDRAVKFFAADICAALITSWIWLPSFRQFSDSGRSESALSKFTEGSFFYNFADNLVLIMITAVIPAAIILSFFRRKLFSSGAPAFYRLMTFVLIAGALISPINKLWHTGSYQAFSLRYGFIIILFGLSMCAVLLSSPERLTVSDKKKVSRSTIVMFILFILAAAFFAVGIYLSKNLKLYTTYLSTEGKDAAAIIALAALGAIVYIFLIHSYMKGKLRKITVLFLMSGLTLCESFFCFCVFVNNTTDVTNRFAQTVELSEKINDDDFYRVKSTKRYFYSNMTEALGYNSIAHYTSLTDRDFLFTAKRMGYSSYWMDSSSNGGTIVTDAFLMNKYFFGQSGDMNSLCIPYDNKGVIDIYENCAVSDGAVISSVSPEEMSGFDSCERIDSTSFIAEKLYGAEETVKKIEPYMLHNLEYYEENGRNYFNIIDESERAYIYYTFFVSGSCELYFDIFSEYSTRLVEPYFGAATVYVNGIPKATDYPNKKENGIISMGSYEDKYVSVMVKVNEDFDVNNFGLYMLETEKIADTIKSVSTGKIILDKNKVRISASAAEGDYVYIPLSYNEGYTASLNGKSVDIEKVMGSFMAVKLENGQNELVLTYFPEGFKISLVLSLAGAVLLLLLLLISRRSSLGMPEKISSAAAKCSLLLSIGSFTAVYIISCIVWVILKIT